MKNKLWIFLIGSPLLALILVSAQVYYFLSVWKYDQANTIFEVKPGEGFSSINGRLGKADIISSTKLFHRYSQVMGLMTRFKAGKFEITQGANMLSVATTLTEGRPITVDVTIPEGKNIFEIAVILSDIGVIRSAEEFIQVAKDPVYTKKLGISGNSVEGYLYPDTYKFTPGISTREAIRVMVAEFNKKTKDLNFGSAPQKLSVHDVITLASIVEKETGAKFERPIIAGVFHNRLAKKMRLQSDPTTIYGIYENFTGNLRRKHLLEKTPYNTYKISGLPVGPISNPGIASIKAVLYPEQHSYLYFVSQNDGTHVFTSTYREHQQAVEKFQKNYHNRAGKSWRNLKQ